MYDCFVCAERQQQQSLEIERYKIDWQHERNESDKLRQQMHQLQVSYMLLISITECEHHLRGNHAIVVEDFGIGLLMYWPHTS